jgi:hypothetical protein
LTGPASLVFKISWYLQPAQQANAVAWPDDEEAMLPSQSPFTSASQLRELPFTVDGSLAWLASTPQHTEWAIGERCADKLPSQLVTVRASAKTHGVTLPKEFVNFIGTPALHTHIRSVTACFLDVAESVLPFANGYLIRFLADQQGCAFWYLYVATSGTDHCVVCSYEYFDADEMDYAIDELKESAFQFWAESFEAFLMRFWLENEILFAKYDSTPPPDLAPRFLESYSQ